MEILKEHLFLHRHVFLDRKWPGHMTAQGSGVAWRSYVTLVSHTD